MRLTSDLLAVVVLGYLRRYCWGREAARTQGRIGLDLRDIFLQLTTRDVRDALSDLVLAGWPVGTTAANPAGAFICETRDDYLAAYRNLYVRVRGQARRCRRFRETARAALSGPASRLARPAWRGSPSGLEPGAVRAVSSPPSAWTPSAWSGPRRQRSGLEPGAVRPGAVRPGAVRAVSGPAWSLERSAPSVLRRPRFAVRRPRFAVRRQRSGLDAVRLEPGAVRLEF